MRAGKLRLYVYCRLGANKLSATRKAAPTQIPLSATLNAGQCQPAT
jgi:hypothetical protein